MKLRRISVAATLSLLAVASLALAGCLNVGAMVIDPIEQTLPTYGLVSPAEAEAMIQTYQGDPNFVLLDIRIAEEVADGHLLGAVNLDFYSPTFRAELERLDRSKLYLIYCRTANRTGQARPLMNELGFQKVYDLAGGIRLWLDCGYPICVGAIGEEHTCATADSYGIN